MDRYYWDRNTYNNDNRYDYDYDRTNYNRDRGSREDYDRDDNRYNGYDREDKPGRQLKQQFERDYQSHHNDRNSDRDRDYRSRDYDMEDNYYENTRGDRNSLGDIRQGYGYSSFGDNDSSYSSGKFRDMQRERSDQYGTGYGSGMIGGYSGSRFGGANYSAHGDFGGSSDYGSMSGSGGNMDNLTSSSGYGNSSSSYSDRGQPDYRMRGFGNDYGAGTGSTYGGSSYSDGADYSGSNDRGTMGRNSYGNSSSDNDDEGYVGRSSGASAFRGSTYGYSGNSGYGIYNDRYSSDSDRGGYINRDPNRDY